MTHSEIIDSNTQLDTIAPFGKIGLIALATDFNSEQDLRRMHPEGVEVFTNRVLNANPVTMENLRHMAGDISRAGAGILRDIQLDAMIYGCTSVTVANGTDNIEKAIKKPVVTSNQALVWHSLILINYVGVVEGYGWLFNG